MLQYRLENEYGAPTRRESAPWNLARWIRDKAAPDSAPRRGEATRPQVKLPTGAALAKDIRGAWVVLLPNDWMARYFAENNPGIEVLPVSGGN